MITSLSRIKFVVGLLAGALIAGLLALAPQQPAQAQQSAVTAAECEGGMAGPYECDHVDLDSFLPLPSLGQGNGNDIWGWTDPETGNEYALFGSSTATGFIDVTDPKNPQVVGQLPSEVPTDAQAPLWRDIKVVGNYAFIVSEFPGHGMQVFDLTKLRDASAGTIFSTDAVYTGGPEGESLGHAHNVGANPETGFVYVVGSNTCTNAEGEGEHGGLHMVDVRNPEDPQFAGCALIPAPPQDSDEPNNNYVHDVQCVVYNGPDTDYQGREICLGSNENVVAIYDVTDKDNPKVISTVGYDTAAYTHQGWLTADQEHFVFGDEGDETAGTVDNTTTYVMNVADLDAPGIPKAYAADTQAIDHNLYIPAQRGRFMFSSNYAAGLRILEFDDTSLADGQFNEVAFFDMFPGDPTEFVGTWSNYAFFDSGTVVVSSIFDQKNGLFVLDPNITKVAITDTEVQEGDEGTTEMTFDVSLSQPAQETIAVDFAAEAGTATADNDFEPASGTLTFEPEQTSKQITVTVNGDTADEPDEFLRVALSETPDALLADDGQATGIIRDDDGAGPGPVSACDEDFVPQEPFGDIADSVHEDNIECIAWYGITQGVTADSYAPGNEVSRAQMASYLTRLAVEGGVELPDDPDDAFEDDTESVHQTAINTAAALDIAAGVGDTDGDGAAEFAPDATVSRGQMASFIANTHALVTGALPGDAPDAFGDDSGSEHEDDINALAALGVIQGVDGDGGQRAYRPADPILRSTMATFTANDLKLFVADGDAFAGGAQVTLDDIVTEPGGPLAGRLGTHKQLDALTADGCGLNNQAVTVDEDSFEVTIPEDQEPGACSLTATATTTRPATDSSQEVAYTFEVTITGSDSSQS